MPLNKPQLENRILTLIEELSDFDGTSPGQTQDDAKTKFKNDLASAIDEFVRTGLVTTTVASGISVQVDPNTGTGATIGPGAGTGAIT